MTQTLAVSGTCDPRFLPVRAAFADTFSDPAETGASLAVVVDGRPVVDLWAGFRDAARTLPWEPDTIVVVYSATKGAVATCAHMLVDRGLLDLDRPVADYWPEFAQSGKERLPVRYLLDHRAGLPGVRRPLPAGSWADWEMLTEALAAETPWWEPGTRHGYHALTYGYLVGEVIRRVTGRTPGTFFRDEVAGPLGLDFHIGLTAETDARTAEALPVAPPSPDAPPSAIFERLRDPESVTARAFAFPPDPQPGLVNLRAWRAAEIPAANGHTNARSLARLYGALARGGEFDGVRLLQPETLATAATEQAAGEDAVLGMGDRFALGFMLPSPMRPFSPNPRAFGHSGAGGALGFADPDARLGFGYAMNRAIASELGGDPRWRALIDAVYAAL